MIICFYDGSRLHCNKIEFGVGELIVDEYRIVNIDEILKIVG